jgi:hypothetical protein
MVEAALLVQAVTTAQHKPTRTTAHTGPTIETRIRFTMLRVFVN